MLRPPARSLRRVCRGLTTLAVVVPLAVSGAATAQDERANADALEPPLPTLPKRPADPGMPGEMGSGKMNSGEMSGDETPAFVSEEPMADRTVPLPRPIAGAGRPSDAALRARYGMAGGTCLPFGPPPACGVGPADRCVGLPYAGFLYYGTPACDDDCLNHTWTTDTAGQGEPGAAKVARHARRHEAAPRSRRSWLPWRH
ncbi:hypothetical protein [Alienimonas californiensis]|uniref:Uncharacterized protein n=1 Tax=Alienimonas californiensis TaxID=2527989 RepID=A0A517P5T9_9PLAN|nr:hypothetical protein [Alienimonas californiensis]QDT14732.1 hypothetical protein CA12_08100 [Alienimonas californiensis]